MTVKCIFIGKSRASCEGRRANAHFVQRHNIAYIERNRCGVVKTSKGHMHVKWRMIIYYSLFLSFSLSFPLCLSLSFPSCRVHRSEMGKVVKRLFLFFLFNFYFYLLFFSIQMLNKTNYIAIMLNTQ